MLEDAAEALGSWKGKALWLNREPSISFNGNSVTTGGGGVLILRMKLDRTS